MGWVPDAGLWRLLPIPLVTYVLLGRLRTTPCTPSLDQEPAVEGTRARAGRLIRCGETHCIDVRETWCGSMCSWEEGGAFERALIMKITSSAWDGRLRKRIFVFGLVSTLGPLANF
ncbi:hypothetical protein BS47DRAFT_45432 [Hydnum rufescens UP504]|uniref:Secreted protein n=1 Tax=Hydnum rufescens UP504 TaxID=1448309 RepID=A0A9P6AS07_9AGAM|nr:hypothetical protein BS47DRAFT_45432 [Hydnum rufescens UP504]